MPNYIRVKQINQAELTGFFVDSISSESGLLLDFAEQAALAVFSSGTVLLTGNQNISGNKTFLNNLNVSGDVTIAGTLRYNEIIDTTVTGNISGYTGIFDSIYANNIIYNTGNNILFITGDQNVSGNKTFLDNLNISGDLTLNGGLYINDIEELNLTGANIYADNLVYNTGDQTINGIKTFAVNSSSRVLVSGSRNGEYALSLVNTSNQGNVLYLKKGATVGGGAFTENFVIKAVDRSDDLIFTLKSSQPGSNRAGFFCDPDDVNDVGGPNIQQDSVVVSGRTYIIDDELKYILSDSTSIQSINPIDSYTGGLFFNPSGLNLYFKNQDQTDPELSPIQITTGNDVLINGNSSFGNYVVREPYDNHKLFKTNYLRGTGLQNIQISGLKTNNIINVFSDFLLANLGEDPNSSIKSYQYIMVDGPIANSRNAINITGGLYSGKGLRRFKTGPTIANGYKNIPSLQYGGALVTPKQKYLETVYNITVESGQGAIRPLTFNTPIIGTANNPIITLKFNFQADTGVCIVSGRYQDSTPIFTITGANYDFIQTERLMYHYVEGGGTYVRI